MKIAAKIFASTVTTEILRQIGNTILEFT